MSHRDDLTKEMAEETNVKQSKTKKQENDELEKRSWIAIVLGALHDNCQLRQ